MTLQIPEDPRPPNLLLQLWAAQHLALLASPQIEYAYLFAAAFILPQLMVVQVSLLYAPPGGDPLVETNINPSLFRVALCNHRKPSLDLFSLPLTASNSTYK